MSDLSVVVPTWNARELVLACLASLEDAAAAARRAGLRVETVVVDAGSRDGTPAAVRARFPWARVLELPANAGFAASCNAALRRTRGRHVLLLNSDARLLPGAGTLERAVRFLDARPDVGLLGPQLVHADGARQNSAHAFPSLLEEVVPRPLLRALSRRRLPPKHRLGPAPVDVDALTGAALFARGALLRDVGPLPEQYFFFLEETAWCWRARRAGWRVVLLPRARVVHLQGGSSKRSDPARTRIEYHRSLYRFYREHRGRIPMALCLSLRAGKALFYVVTQAPLGLAGGRARARWRVHAAVLLWHLRGRPVAGGLRGLAPARDARSPARPGVRPVAAAGSAA